jgi:hypothetical protein
MSEAKWVIYRPVDQTVVGVFDTEVDAYVWVDKEWGELNADEFLVLLCASPKGT